jgi:hypothetical protein
LARKLGDKIPDPLYEFLDANSKRKNLVIFLMTVDDNDFPHYCLLSPYQVFSLEKGRDLIMSVYSKSNTTSFLKSRKPASLILVVPPQIYYLKGEVRVRSLPESTDPNTMFIFTVSEASVDYSDQAPISTAVLFDDSKIREKYQFDFNETVRAIKGVTELHIQIVSG